MPAVRVRAKFYCNPSEVSRMSFEGNTPKELDFYTIRA